MKDIALLLPAALNALSQGQGRALIGLSQRVPETFAGSPDLCASLATAYMFEGLHPQAIKVMQACLDQNPGFAGGRALLARLLCSVGRSADGLAQAREAVKLEPDVIVWKLTLAEALAEDGRLEESRAEFAKLPDDLRLPSPTWMLLEAMRLESDKGFRAALAADPSSALALKEFGHFLAELGREREAADLLSTLLESHPSYLPGLTVLRDALVSISGSVEERHPGDQERYRALLIRVNEAIQNLTAKA